MGYCKSKIEKCKWQIEKHLNRQFAFCNLHFAIGNFQWRD